MAGAVGKVCPLTGIQVPCAKLYLVVNPYFEISTTPFAVTGLPRNDGDD
jgi:hypothetical protein